MKEVHMKNYIEVNPLEGIVIDEDEILFGFTKEDVFRIIGAPQRDMGDSLYYFGSSLRFDFEDGKLVFIEFLGGIDGPFQPVIYGENAFEMTSDSLVKLITRHGGELQMEKKGCTALFKNLSLSCYREITPEDVTDMIREAASSGTPMTAEAILSEKRMANHWATVGIGIKDYYNKQC